MGACMSLCEKLSLFPKKNQEAQKQGGVYLDESFQKKDKNHRLRVGLLSKDEENNRKESISIELQSRRVMEEKEREIEEYNQEQEAIQQLLPNNISGRQQQQLTRYSKKREAQQIQNDLMLQRDDSERVKKEKEQNNEIIPQQFSEKQQQKQQDKTTVLNNSQVSQEDQRKQINPDKDTIAKEKTAIEEQSESSIIQPIQSPKQPLGQRTLEGNQHFREEIKEKPVFNSAESGNLLMQLDKISESKQQEQIVKPAEIVLDGNDKGQEDQTHQINTNNNKDDVILPVGSQNIKLSDEDGSRIAPLNDHLLHLSDKVKDIMLSGSEQDDLRTCAHTGQRNTAKGSYDEETNQEPEGHHLSSQNIDENEEEEENEEKIKAKEDKIKEIRLSLQQQLNVIKPTNSQIPPSNFLYHSKSHQHHQPMSQPSYIQSSYQSHKDQYPFQTPQQHQQQQQHPHGLGHAHSVSQNLNNITDETDFSLLLNYDSQKNSIIYGNFHPNAFRDSKFILDESIIHPVRDIITNGEDSDTSSKKEEWISDQLRKQQSTQDLVSLLQPARTSLESMNKFDKQSKDNYTNYSENQYFSRQKAESEKAKVDSIESISYSDKRASPMNINTISLTPKAKFEEQLIVRQQEERFSPQKMTAANQGKSKGGSQDDLLPVKEEEDSRVVPTKIDEFSFCFDDAANNNEEQDIDQFMKRNSKIFSAMHHGWSNQEEPVISGKQQSEINKNSQRISTLSQPQKNSNFERNQKKRCQSESEQATNEKELDRLLPLPDFGGAHKVSNNEKKVDNIEDTRNVNDKKIEVVEISTPEAANQSNSNSNQTNSLTYSPILPLELSFPLNNPKNISKDQLISQAQSEPKQIQTLQKNELSNFKSTQNDESYQQSDLKVSLSDNVVKNNENLESQLSDNKNLQVNNGNEDKNKLNVNKPINQQYNQENLTNVALINADNDDKKLSLNDISLDKNIKKEDNTNNQNDICVPNSQNPMPIKEEIIDNKSNESHLLPLNPSHIESPRILEASSDHPSNISIVIQDPKNNTTEQLVYTIHPYNSKISLQRNSEKEVQLPEGSEKTQQPKVNPNDPAKALQFHKSLLENTNRIVMQKRRTPSISSQIPRDSLKQVLSQSSLEESNKSKVEKILENNSRNIEGQMNIDEGLNGNFKETKTPHEGGQDEEEKKQNENQQVDQGSKLKHTKNEESTLEQNSKLLEEEWKSARGNFSQIEDNTLFYSALGDHPGNADKSQDISPANQFNQMKNASRTSLGQGNIENFTNGVFEESKTLDDLNVSDGKNICKSDSFKSCRDDNNNSNTNSSSNISPIRMGRSASVNYFKAGVVQMKNSTESPFESCFHTPSGSIRGSLKILQNDLYQRRSISNMQQVSYFKKSSVTSQQYYDCDSYQLQVIDSEKLVNRDLVEHPETYMEWIQTLPVIFEIPAVLSSEALYQFELIKQETYQDFVVKLQSENTDNFDLFDVIIDGPNRTIFFRSELGLDQQRVFIVIGEYYVKTHSYAAFYNFKNSFDSQHRLNAFDTLSPLNDDLQNTILVGVSTHRLLPKPCEFLFLKHFSFLQQTGVEDDENNNNNNQVSPIEQMCEIDISLNSEEIEQHLKANKKSIPQNSQIRGELFSGNIATTIQNENQIKVEILFEHNFHNALTAQQARHMYTEMFTQFFEKLDATFP